jgi:aryl-alcohol dehydrogenase-like predicted oxidoreductase
VEYRECGDSGLKLPVLGIGCWAFGGGDYWGPQNQADVDLVVDRAIDIGCTYFDTAEVYNDGESEKSLGFALKGKRNRAIIGSKVSPNHTSPNRLRKACEKSLKRLGTDYIDLYMVHWPIHSHALRHYTYNQSIIENPPKTVAAFDGLEALKKEGKILYYGVSNYGRGQLKELHDAGYKPAANELCYNLISRAIELEILPLCRDLHIGIIGYMPLMQGLLTGKYKTIDDMPWQRTRTRHFSGGRKGSRHGEAGVEPLLIDALEQLGALTNELDEPLHRLALAWSISNEAITSTICGARNVDQLTANASAIDLGLGAGIYEQMSAITERIKAAMGPSPDYYEGTAKSRTW